MLAELLTLSRYFAWQKSVEIGTKLAEEHPEIREQYGNSWTLERIAKELDVKSNYDASRRVAITSISYALSILIPDYDARAKLREAHHQAGARKRYELHGSSFTKEQCEAGGRNLYEKLTKKEKREKSLGALLAQNKLHWSTPDPAKATGTDKEIEAAFDEAFFMLKDRIEDYLNDRVFAPSPIVP